ncbi:homeobox protein 2-like isoform X2 [Ruditapes philippinarum]|uniref:homeobox protein 2-like isoform X2 n=1 Tax=Ruditapes philippinarum TaxID=129788 RepID=UPI00295C3A5B|nr:homeobox protein 2-like isoform X2 [Ruditapes philippinarum]
MSGIMERLRSQSSSTKMGPGKALSIYDGRKWPVVKCGAVYVTDEDKTKTVTKNVISLSSASEEKKKQKSSKYTVAIGSSFGHVHSFLKDSDNVLKSYEKTQAEDKCLLLIRKPKSASKQSFFSLKMLKAHSWADVSVKDMHLRQPDGSLKHDPYKAFKDRFKKKTDLSLPPEEWNTLASQSAPFKGPTANQSSSFKSQSSADDRKEVNKNDIVSNKPRSEDIPNLSNSYPYIKKGNRHISQSLADLTESGQEINNNKNMGGAFSQGHAHGRPKGPPPAVPPRTNASDIEKYNKNLQRSQSGDNLNSSHNKNTNYERTENKPDIISNVNVRQSPGDKIRDTRPEETLQMRMKHDSGFHSEAPLSSDEMYDSGFKQDLSKSVQNGNHMTSSPKSARRQQNSNRNMPRHNSDPRQQNVPSEHEYRSKGPSPGNYKNKGPSPGNKDIRSQVKQLESADSRQVQRNQSNGSENRNRQNEQGRVRNVPGGQFYPDGNRNRPVEQKQTSSDSRNQQSYRQGGTTGSKQHENRPRSSEKIVQRRSNEFRDRKSLLDVREGHVLTIDNKESVIKAHSLGDLSTGCAFSLVGQKKPDVPGNEPVLEFTGTQLMRHIRNYKEMASNGSGGSLPFRGKTLDDMDTYKQYYGDGQPSTNGNNANKLKHYGSLQHLPMSVETNKQQSGYNQPVPVRHREKTPLKPRRCLPQPPGDVQVKKKQMTDIMINRMGVDSSSTSPSSSNSNRDGSIEPRPGGISATPSVSDREVFDLLHSSKTDLGWNMQGVRNVCNINSNNNHNNSSSSSKKQTPASQVPPSYGDTMHNALRKSGSFGSHEHGNVPPSGGRLSDSGQTTLTSQSTIDSGYITNDPDPETLSTSSYAKTLKQSAHNMYTSHKLYKPTKGDHSQKQPTSSKGDHSNSSYINPYNQKHAKDSHTRNWVENHQGTYMSDHLKLHLQPVPSNEKLNNNSNDKMDKNNNRHPKIPENKVTELDLTQNAPIKPERTFQYGKQTLAYHKSEVSYKDLEKRNQDQNQLTCKSKGKSISMAQGLNLINSSSEPPIGGFLSKSQPKFTGSLKDLIGTDKQIVPIETLKLESANSTNTLPGSWKFQAQTRPECSLKFFGKPSLFQLLQNYSMYAVRVQIPDNFVIMENVKLKECEVLLPSPWLFGKDTSSPLSPKGSYAKLGGPNSAFRPVSVVNTSPIKSVAMVTIMELTNQMTGLIESGQLQKGDLIVEVNERLVMGEDLPTLTNVFQACQGELLLTIARDRARDNHPMRDKNSTSPTDEDFRRMEQKINELTTELRKKDRTLKQLSALLPWPLPSSKGKNSSGKDDEAYVCSLSEDEFIV